VLCRTVLAVAAAAAVAGADSGGLSC
jgi:hypothetical protein